MRAFWNSGNSATPLSGNRPEGKYIALKAGAALMCMIWRNLDSLQCWIPCNAGFLAMLDAAKSFDANAGFAFMTWLGFKIKTAFQEAAGCRTKRQMMEPIDSAVSLETPLTDEENGDVLGDVIPDPAAELAFDEIAENDRLRRLHDALEDALSTLTPEQADALRMKYFERRPADAKTCQKGLRVLRRPNISKELKDFL